MTYSIKHLFHIDASREKFFEAISTIKGLANWWTTDTDGNAAIGGVIQFRFAASGGPDMKVTESKPNEKVSWLTFWCQVELLRKTRPYIFWVAILAIGIIVPVQLIALLVINLQKML